MTAPQTMTSSNDAAADLRVFADVGALATAAARDVAQLLTTAVREHGSASIALAGGRTPRGLYRCLALDHRHDTPWDRVHVYWSDERDVPHDDDRSNYRMAREWADARAAAHLATRSPR